MRTNEGRKGREAFVHSDKQSVSVTRSKEGMHIDATTTRRYLGNSASATVQYSAICAVCRTGKGKTIAARPPFCLHYSLPNPMN